MTTLNIAGYRLLTSEEIKTVNQIKEIEERVLRVCDALHGIGGDERWLNIGINHLQQGFGAVVRSITKPDRIRLPEDDQVVEAGGTPGDKEKDQAE